MNRIADHLLHALAAAVHRLLRRPEASAGAHAIALTPERKIVLVNLRYAKGWRLPGGGRTQMESVSDAVLRELREEIGMVSHGDVRQSGIEGLLIVDDVLYRPRKWSWEVEAICEAAQHNLPSGLSPRTAQWLEAARDRL